ncbi:MAG: CHAT domain-containing protein [Vulcanimicrobiota bacterium]
MALLLTAGLQAEPVPELIRRYHHQEALEKIQARLAQSRAAERSNLLFWKSECLIELRRFAEAERCLNQLPAGPRRLLLQARLSREQDRDDLAEQELVELLKGPESPETLDGALRLATLLAEHGRPEECDQRFSQALEIADGLPDSQINWLRLYHQRAVQLEKTARIVQAIDWCRLSSRHLEKIDPRSTNPLRTLEAMLLGRLQRYEQADRCWNQIVRRHPEAVSTLVAWGYDMLYQRNDLAGCQRFLATSQNVLQRQSNPDFKLHVLLIQAQVYLFRLHDAQKAEALLAQAQPLSPNLPRVLNGGWRVGLRFHPYGPEPSSEREWVAWMRLMAMDRRKAPLSETEAFMRATAPQLRTEERGPWLWELSSRFADPSAAQQALQMSRGLQRAKLIVSMIQKGQADRALFREALNLLDPSEREQAQNFLLESASEAAISWRSPARLVAPDEIKALRPNPLIERLEARQDQNRLIPLLSAQTARLFLEGRRAEALASAYQMLAWAERHHEDNTAASALSRIARIEAASGHFERSLELLQRSREIRIQTGERESEVAAARGQASVLSWAGQTEQADRLAREYGLTLDATRPADPLPPPLPLISGSEFLAANARLTTEIPQFSTSVAMLPSRMVELAAQLPTDQALVQIFLNRQEAILLLATPEGFAIRRQIVSRLVLEEWARTLRQGLRNGKPDPAVADGLRGLILEPLQVYLSGRKVTLVCPGLLEDLPWDLLGADWNTWWLWAGEASRPYPASSQPKVLGLGDVPGLDLPATRVELQQLAEMFPGQSDLLLGPGATRSALERLAAGSDILHLATHASLEREADQAHLMLADGPYSARQVFACPLKPGALVVLSACNTANSRGQERAPTTLANAFLAAGASQVVATLAPVEDEAARRFFASFYGQLRSGLGPDQALQRAKAERAAADSDKNWAAFVLLRGCP